jgi:RES domain-containing protein
VKLDPKIVAELALAFQPQSYLRVIPAAHAATPLGMGLSHTRFSSPDRTFRLIYLARDLATAIAETIVRDRFEDATERVLDHSEIEEWAVAEVSAPSSLVVLDLRTTGLLRLGVSTDATRAKAHREGQQLSKAVYNAFAVDGLLYSSRLTSAECLAVYDRAVEVKLVSTRAVNLVRHPDLIPALKSIGVAIRSAPSTMG